MIRKMLQSALCLLLSPLLAAQQATQQQVEVPAAGPIAAAPAVPESFTIAKGTAVKLIALDSTTSATATRGATVRYLVEEDVVVDGVTVIRAGTPVTGTVTKAKKGSTHHPEGELEIGIRKIEIGKGLDLKLAESMPGAPSSAQDGNDSDSAVKTKRILTAILLTPLIIPILAVGMPIVAPVMLLLWIDERKQESASPHWTDVTLAQCSTRTVYVASAITIPTTGLAAQAGAPAAPEDSLCSLASVPDAVNAPAR